jgi:uncharacterized protein (DUF433 family)
MNLPDFLVEVPYNDIRLKGSRISLYHVIDCHREQGFNAEQIHEEFDTLSVEVLNKVLQFYQENRDEVDAYMRDCQEEYERQYRAAKPFDLEELRRRMKAKQQENA